MLSGQSYDPITLCYTHESYNMSLDKLGRDHGCWWWYYFHTRKNSDNCHIYYYTVIACRCDTINLGRIHYGTYRSSVDEDNDHDDNEYNKDDENDLPFVVLPDDEPECLPWWGEPEEWCCWAVRRIKLGVHVGVISGLSCRAQLRLLLRYNLNFKLKLCLNYNGNKINCYSNNLKLIVVCM